jgi:hypothetical protein
MISKIIIYVAHDSSQHIQDYYVFFAMAAIIQLQCHWWWARQDQDYDGQRVLFEAPPAGDRLLHAVGKVCYS